MLCILLLARVAHAVSQTATVNTSRMVDDVNLYISQRKQTEDDVGDDVDEFDGDGNNRQKRPRGDNIAEKTKKTV